MINSANKKHINELFNREAKHSFYIPRYQREYTWGYNEWAVLFDDLMENDEEYFIGSIIYISTNDAFNPRLEVIDGQQRLTTMSLLLAALYTVMQNHKAHLEEDDLYEIPSLKNSLKSKSSENKLMITPQVQNSNLQDYNSLMYEIGIGEFAKKPSYSARRKIYRCYNYFVERLNWEIDHPKEGRTVNDMIMGIKSKVMSAMVVAIEVSTHSDAYVMFESLNHRGTPLTAIDLMKNLIMARAEKHGLSCDECFDKWVSLLQHLPDNYAIQERFFRHYYNAFKDQLNTPFRNSDDRKKDPLGVIATKSNLLSIYEKLINRDLQSFLDDILKCAQIYNELLFPERYSDLSYSDKLVDLKHVQAVPSYLLLMYLIHNKRELELDDSLIGKIIDYLVLFFIRRNVTDTPNTRDITRLLMEIVSDIEDSGIKGKVILEHVTKVLKASSASDEYFRRKLEGDIYRENVDATRYLLCALAQKHMTKESWTDLWQRYEKGGTYVWTIEHIFPEEERIPQDWVDMIADGDRAKAEEYRETYVHKIGNLTITGYNTELSNYSFKKKRDRQNKKGGTYIGYKNGLEINRLLAEKDSWTVEDIQERTSSMVDEIMEIFKI